MPRPFPICNLVGLRTYRLVYLCAALLFFAVDGSPLLQQRWQNLNDTLFCGYERGDQRMIRRLVNGKFVKRIEEWTIDERMENVVCFFWSSMWIYWKCRTCSYKGYFELGNRLSFISKFDCSIGDVNILKNKANNSHNYVHALWQLLHYYLYYWCSLFRSKFSWLRRVLLP